MPVHTVKEVKKARKRITKKVKKVTKKRGK